MIKIVLVLICAINLFACNPVEKYSAQQAQVYPFVCLVTQNNCTINTALGLFSIKFSGLAEQGQLKTELPFQIQLRFTPNETSHKLSNAQSYLEGKTMFMGKVPVFFEQSTTRNSLMAETLLASCSEEVMTWRLWLQVDIVTGKALKQQEMAIEFDSVRL